MTMEHASIEAPSNESQDLSSRIALAAHELKKIALALKHARKPDAKNRARTLDLLQKAGIALSACAKLEKECQDTLLSYGETSDRAWSELDTHVKDICTRNHWRIDGSWPSYVVAYGVRLDFDTKSRSVVIGGIQLPGNDLTEVEAALHEQTRTLLPKNFEPQEFLEALASAYLEARRTSSQVPILEVYKSLVIRSQRPGFWKNAARERFVGLTLEQFRARLSSTLEANALRTKSGKELRFFPPLDPKDAIFLFNPLEGRLGFVGRVEFSGDAT